ncbi:MAG TPA: hypothetical protein VEC99_17850, partial [Clostridia bacterium]|nr:hypothetical protein [Clostridia bacterium]
KQYLVYVRTGLGDQKDKANRKEKFAENELSLDLTLSPGKFRAEWLDTKTGTFVRREDFKHASGAKHLEAPAFEDDIALVVRAR